LRFGAIWPYTTRHPVEEWYVLRPHQRQQNQLAQPGVARADAAWQPFGLEIAPADESPDASAAAEPALDLSFEPVAAGNAEPQRSIPALAPPASAERAPKAPFSVGLDIRTRHEVGDEATQEASEEATLTDEVSGIMKRSTFGLTGTYRF
jgi:hypothetical protein